MFKTLDAKQTNKSIRVIKKFLGFKITPEQLGWWETKIPLSSLVVIGKSVQLESIKQQFNQLSNHEPDLSTGCIGLPSSLNAMQDNCATNE